MQQPLIKIRIERDVMMKPTLRVFPFEVPILQAKLGADTVYEVKDAEVLMRDVDEDMIYQSLIKKHGTDPNGTPWVTLVYGHDYEGRLMKAIERGAEVMRGKKSKKEVTDDSTPTHENEDA